MQKCRKKADIQSSLIIFTIYFAILSSHGTQTKFHTVSRFGFVLQSSHAIESYYQCIFDSIHVTELKEKIK